MNKRKVAIEVAKVIGCFISLPVLGGLILAPCVIDGHYKDLAHKQCSKWELVDVVEVFGETCEYDRCRVLLSNGGHTTLNTPIVAGDVLIACTGGGSRYTKNRLWREEDRHSLARRSIGNFPSPRKAAK